MIVILEDFKLLLIFFMLTVQLILLKGWGVQMWTNCGRPPAAAAAAA
jgi:hypothetical protein